jgi:DUF4097 and DUF4098 domain-containing protein YvlB
MTVAALRVSGAVLAASLFAIAPAQSQSRRFNLSVNVGENASSCADLHVKTNGALAQESESFTVAGASIQLDTTNGAINVIAQDRADYAVEACRFAVAEDQATARQVVASTSVTHAAWIVEAHGPSANIDSRAQWQVYLLVQAPRNGSVEVNTVNGPISLQGLSGTVKATAVNGPLSLRDCAGTVDARTTNGPVSFTGQGGDVKLTAVNGPVSVNLAAGVWSGPRLDLSSVNGPVSLNAPDSFSSPVRIETSGHGMLNCKAEMCRSALTDTAGGRVTMHMNGSGETVRISSENGPIAISPPSSH